MNRKTNEQMLDHLARLGRVFSGGKSFTALFRDLMEEVRKTTGAEGGSLFIHDWSTQTLKIVVLTNDVLNFHKVVEYFDPLRIDGFIEVPMRGADGQLNLKNPSVCCFHEKRNILLPDMDLAGDEFDFSKTRQFDRENNYKTRNLSVFPLYGHGEKLIGVLQLINADDDLFAEEMRPFVDALLGQVSIVLNNALLVSEAQNLLAAIVSMVGVAIDEKSPHTAGHCQRVTALTLMVADEMSEDKDGAYASFSLGEDERRELQMASMLHDIGKIITPMHIMEKPTKLFTLYDRINLLRERLQAEKLSEEVKRLKSANGGNGNGGSEVFSEEELAKYEEDFKFLNAVNRGETFVDDKAEKRLEEISGRTIEFEDGGAPMPIIGDEEMRNLQVARGTLNTEERKIMEGHVSASIRLLSSIPWPRNLERVVEYAGAHHESMNGRGYPKGLTGDQMSLPSRILGMADRFEAISAPDRPYRKVKMTLSRVMDIMQKMADSNEIDPDLFGFFKDRNIHMRYAREFLPPELIDCD